ncbi:MAG: hypothetical protein HY931_02130 [Candidatus Falkowbacteria bacterium]|nr:MAG: hypothetical protein HY931_02130 [Candidatus Falkowbacteria bacterium]
MNKKLFLYFSAGIFGLFVLLQPQVILAAQLIFKLAPNTIDGGATLVEVYLDPQSKKVNVVEGIISFQGTDISGLSVGTETGGSVLKLWPTPPTYSAGSQTVRFAGGVPQGFDQTGLLFRLRLASTASSSISVLWSGGMAYLNDGQGTQENIFARSITVNLDKQASETAIVPSADTTPPTFVSVETGQDPNTYAGQQFISLNATDDISGVNRYEVKEGEVITEVTDGVYVFKDQNRKTPVTVTAYDQAGNSQTIEIPARFNQAKNVTIILVIIILFGFSFWYVYKKNIKK